MYNQQMMEERSEIATLAAGCFWGVQAAFDEMSGVMETTVGYTGGAAANPSYSQVCAGGTGHAEAVAIKFDPARVSFKELLAKFWSIHNPTTLNRQGPDVGAKIQSPIFHRD